jgi:hypothetical protein
MAEKVAGLMSNIEVCGFGSFFVGKTEYGDIDLLLVHADRSKESCAHAIRCKRELQAALQNLHVTMLSKQAEQSFSFKLTAQAKHIGFIDMFLGDPDIKKIVASIKAYSPSQLL